MSCMPVKDPDMWSSPQALGKSDRLMQRYKFLPMAMALLALAASCSSKSNGHALPTTVPSTLNIGSTSTTGPPTSTPSSTGTPPTSSLPHPTATTVQTAPVPTTVSTSGTRCLTTELAVSPSGNGAAAGSTLYYYAVVNMSNHSCTLSGFFGMEPFDTAGHAIPVTLVRQTIPGRGNITLVSRGHGTLTFSSGGAVAGDCKVAATLHITPPDETDFLAIAAGGFTVCGNGTVFVQQVTSP